MFANIKNTEDLQCVKTVLSMGWEVMWRFKIQTLTLTGNLVSVSTQYAVWDTALVCLGDVDLKICPLLIANYFYC